MCCKDWNCGLHYRTRTFITGAYDTSDEDPTYFGTEVLTHRLKELTNGVWVQLPLTNIVRTCSRSKPTYQKRCGTWLFGVVDGIRYELQGKSKQVPRTPYPKSQFRQSGELDHFAERERFAFLFSTTWNIPRRPQSRCRTTTTTWLMQPVCPSLLYYVMAFIRHFYYQPWPRLLTLPLKLQLFMLHHLLMVLLLSCPVRF